MSWAALVALMARLHGQLTVAVPASVGLGKSIVIVGGSGCEICVASWHGLCDRKYGLTHSFTEKSSKDR